MKNLAPPMCVKFLFRPIDMKLTVKSKKEEGRTQGGGGQECGLLRANNENEVISVSNSHF
jgi:hypothetical protein